MAPIGAVWAPIAQRVLRQALRNTSRLTEALRNKLANRAGAEAFSPQPISVRVAPKQPIHPLALLRQQKRGTKWYSTATGDAGLNTTLRRFLSTGTAPARRIPRSAALNSPVASRAVWQSTGRAPFACTLRPNLTGGALPRTAAGYSLPGRTGARFFSHTPAAPAQVVQNVSQAMRAFWTSGQRARFSGVGPDGQPRYAAVSALQADAAHALAKTPKFLPGAFVDFPLNPTLTALSPLAAAFPFPSETGVPRPDSAATTLGAAGFLDELSADFARSLKELSAVMSDLKRLASLGDLPVLLERRKGGGPALRVRFPGVDAAAVEALCEDLGLARGLVGQDAGFDASVGAPVALRFPFAPGSDAGAKTMTSPGGSVRSRRSSSASESEDEAFLQQFLEDNPWLSSVEEDGEGEMSTGEYEEEGYASMSPSVVPSPGGRCEGDFEGLEGIYRFLAECDRPRPRF